MFHFLDPNNNNAVSLDELIYKASEEICKNGLCTRNVPVSSLLTKIARTHSEFAILMEMV